MCDSRLLNEADGSRSDPTAQIAHRVGGAYKPGCGFAKHLGAINNRMWDRYYTTRSGQVPESNHKPIATLGFLRL